MKEYRLGDDFVNRGLERAVLAAAALDPEVFRAHLAGDPTIISQEREVWAELRPKLVRGEAAGGIVPSEWSPSGNPEAAVAELGRLRKLRVVAAELDPMLSALRDTNLTPEDVAGMFAARAAAANRKLSEAELDAGVPWAADLLDDVLEDVERRVEAKKNGATVLGVASTGIPPLDERIDGWDVYLHLIGGGPGVGKSTFLLDQARRTARQRVIALYVSFENIPQNLLRRVVCAVGGLDSMAARKGTVDKDAFFAASEEWRREEAPHMVLVDGGVHTTVAQVEAIARNAIRERDAASCVIYVDYVHQWAETAAEFADYASDRERYNALLAQLIALKDRLRVPIVGIMAQNRASNYTSTDLNSGFGTGKLEYGGDVVLFLTEVESDAKPPTVDVDLTLAKQRDGPKGEKIKLRVRRDLGHVGLRKDG